MLLSLPPELLQHVLFLLVAAKPLDDLAVLRPIRITSRALRAAAAEPALHARIYRNKFDTAAVERRLFRLTPEGLKEQLECSLAILAAIRRGVPTPEDRQRQLANGLRAGETDIADTLFGALLLMLDNDGKNYAQLEAAGVHDYLRTYAFSHFWEGSLQNGGWPVEKAASACALWLMWLTIDRSRMQSDLHQGRETFLLAINPFVFLAHRYPSSEAPPNNFNLPLTGPTYRFPLPNSSSSAFYPQEDGPQFYPHYLPDRSSKASYFGATPSLAPPLASIAAKLLYVAYREITPFRVPLHLPVDAEEARRQWWAETQATADLVASGVPHAQAATMARSAPITHPLPPVPAHITPPPTLGPTQEDYHALNRGKAAVLPRGARWDWDAGHALRVNWEEDDNVEAAETDESRKWDTLWWRMRLCNHYRAPRPSFEPGAVFDRGSMRGIWKGKIYIPQGNELGAFIHSNPIYPGFDAASGYTTEAFNEATFGIIMQPFALEFQESVRVCGCARTAKVNRQAVTRAPTRADSPSSLASVSSSDRVFPTHLQCGIIPVPPPTVVDWHGIPFDGVLPQDLPNGHPQHAGLPSANPEVVEDPLYEELDSTFERDIRAPKLDYSMSNAWLPGGIGGVTFIMRPAQELLPVADSERTWLRDELVVAVGHHPPLESAQAPCPAFLPRGVPVPEVIPGQYIYELYDPNKISAHDVLHEAAPYSGPSSMWPTNLQGVSILPLDGKSEQHNPSCMRCVDRERARAAIRKKDADEARRVLKRRADAAAEGSRLLEETMERWGLSEGHVPPAGTRVEELAVKDLQLDNEVNDEYLSASEDGDDAEYEDEDVFGTVHGSTAIRGKWVDDTNADGSPLRRFQPGVRCDFDRARVTSIASPCSHAGDTLFTGETPPSGLAWGQKYTTYGRLRPWDGLVGLVRVGHVPMNFMFIFGYIVGGRTFVGEWRVAASDPMRPAWGGSFVMSRVPEGLA